MIMQGIVDLCLKKLNQYYLKWLGGMLMYNNSPSPIMVVSGKTAQEILKKSQKPIGDYTDAINKARERLRKVGAIK